MEKINPSLENLYRAMVLTRTFDTKAVALQRTGKLGTYPSSLGQEALSVGMGFALNKEDVFCPAYRDHGTQLCRGVTMEEILLYWGGSERGNDFEAASAKEDLPNCVPIASQCLHAAGIASAIKIRKQNRAVLVTCGDGATSQGDFYETINIAGVWQLPLVIVIANNQWAISVSRSKQTATPTLDQKAVAGNVAHEQIDGNDVECVYEQLSKALLKARKNGGPTLIEAVTYRLSDHTTADDASRYRSKEEVALAWQNEPIGKARQKLLDQNSWSESQEKQLQNDCSEKVAKAVEHYSHLSKELLSHMFDYQYKNLPHALLLQRESLRT